MLPRLHEIAPSWLRRAAAPVALGARVGLPVAAPPDYADDLDGRPLAARIDDNLRELDRLDREMKHG